MMYNALQSDEGIILRYFNFINSIIDDLDAYAINPKYKFIDTTVSDMSKADHADDLRYLIKSVDRINQLGDYTYSIDGMEIENIEVPDFFRFMLLPTEVYFDPNNRLSSPLIKRIKEVDDFRIDWNQFRRSCINVAAHFRMGKSFKMIKLSDIRTIVSLNDVINRICFDDGDLRFDGLNYFNPIIISNEVKSLYDNVYYNDNLNRYMKEYISKFLVSKMRDSLE